MRLKLFIFLQIFFNILLTQESDLIFYATVNDYSPSFNYLGLYAKLKSSESHSKEIQIQSSNPFGYETDIKNRAEKLRAIRNSITQSKNDFFKNKKYKLNSRYNKAASRWKSYDYHEVVKNLEELIYDNSLYLSQEKRAYLFKQYNLYAIPNVLNILSKFPEYDYCIQDIAKRLLDDKKFSKKICELDCKIEDKHICNFFKEEAQECGKRILSKGFQNKKQQLQSDFKNYINSQVKNTTANEPTYIEVEEVAAMLEHEITEFPTAASRNKRIINALNETVNDNRVYQKEYELTSQTQQFLQDCNIDKALFRICHGNIAQQQLHFEFLDVANQISQIYFQTQSTELKNFSKSTQVIATMGCAAVKKNMLPAATQFLKVCDCLISFAKGVLNSCSDNLTAIAHAIKHPIDTFGPVVINAYKLALWRNSFPDMIDILIFPHDSALILEQKSKDIISIVETISKVALDSYRSCKDSPTERKFEYAGYAVNELMLFLFGDKAVTGTASLFTKLPKGEQFLSGLGYFGTEYAKIIGFTAIKGVDNVKKGIDLLSKNEHILRAQKTYFDAIKVATEHAACFEHYISALYRSIKKQVVDPTYKKLFDRYKLPIYYVPPDNLEFAIVNGNFLDLFGSVWSKNQRNEWNIQFSEITKKSLGWIDKEKKGTLVVEEINQKIAWPLSSGDYFKDLYQDIDRINKSFANVKHTLSEVKGLPIKFELEHFLDIDLKITKKGIDFTGFHHDYMNYIENCGSFIKVTNKRFIQHGVYVADVIINGKRRTKTFFPSDWSREKVVSKIMEASNNVTYVKTLSNNKIRLRCTTSEGIQMDIILKNSGIIESAYPYTNFKFLKEKNESIFEIY